MKRISKQRLEELRAAPDSSIDYSDIPPLTNEFWAKAQIEKPPQKEGVYLKVRSDTLEWFKLQGRGYQAMIDKVLTSYVEYQKQHGNNQNKKN